MNNEFFEALHLLCKEKEIPMEYMTERIANAIQNALKKDYGVQENGIVEIDPVSQKFRVAIRKEIVEEVEDPALQIHLADVKSRKKSLKVGDFVDIEVATKEFGRIAAQTAKHVIRQGIREAEKQQLIHMFQSQEHELITALVQKIEPRTGNAVLEIGRSGEVILPASEQVPGEVLREKDHIKVYVVEIRSSEKGPRAIISRTHPGLVKRLFELEVPEIYEGTVEIKSVSREAGARTKIAVCSSNPDVDAQGSCIGPKGARVNKIVEELGGEKIDIVKYSEDPAAYVAEALAPAQVLDVEILDLEAKSCRATVADNQLSLAIGKDGQNVRLAARLTGWKIDIKSQSQA